MPYPRHLLVPPEAPGTYHCVSRCVRRAFLCGQDPVTGHSFEHRKAWLEARIMELGDLFAVAIHAYAVMSNHIHLVLDVDPTVPADWSDEDVARRWVTLAGAKDSDLPVEARIGRLVGQPKRLAVLRERLGSLSWFMRFLKEPIARRANREDGCTGRFWEGRFKTQALLDDAAVLACMAYVDLNPVRSGLVKWARDAPHTSLRKRVNDGHAPEARLTPVAAAIDSRAPAPSLAAYLCLVDWTGSALEAPQTPSIPSVAVPVLRTLGQRPQQWLIQVPATESRYWRAIGAAHSLAERAREIGQRWLCGLGMARAIEKMVAG